VKSGGRMIIAATIFSGQLLLLAQSPAPVGSPGKGELPLPSTRISYERHDLRVIETSSPNRDFTKSFQLESFGYDLSPNTAGFERAPFNGGNFTAGGLECPFCIMRPLMTRSRFTLQPFGAQATKRAFDGRLETFLGVGGLEAWGPDGLPTKNRHYSNSYNDTWLMQGQIGSRVSVDPGKHLWLGPTIRYLNMFGAPAPSSRVHWNTFGASALWRFGHN